MIGTDSNYTFGKFEVETGSNSSVYSKSFTDVKALAGYRFIHDPNETIPEKCISVAVYNGTEAEVVPCGNFAAVSGLTGVSVNLNMVFSETAIKNIDYYHIIIPAVHAYDSSDTRYVVVKMTKEVELFPEEFPYYELVDTFENAEPTSAEAPSGGITPTGTIQITENDTYDVTNYASAEVNVSGGGALYTELYSVDYPQTVLVGELSDGDYVAEVKIGELPIDLMQQILRGISYDTGYLYNIYHGNGDVNVLFEETFFTIDTVDGINVSFARDGGAIYLTAISETSFSITAPAGSYIAYHATNDLGKLYTQLLTPR